MKKSNNEEFKAVDFMRQVRDEISKDIENFDYKQIKNYFAERRQKIRIIPLPNIHKHS
ncbi:MAG: hypothetical protein K8S23_12895 [Candidatus Cloacimonetes bacterium]|nr:hypothetical protein [Candidatus Cloacimonadota bacterium]